jgi:hypothetical protein
MKRPGDLRRKSAPGGAFGRHLLLNSKNRNHYTLEFPSWNPKSAESAAFASCKEGSLELKK